MYIFLITDGDIRLNNYLYPPLSSRITPLVPSHIMSLMPAAVTLLTCRVW